MADFDFSNNSHDGYLESNRQEEKYKVFVGGLPCDANDEQLKTYFERFGKVLTCKAKKWKSDLSKCKGYALVVVHDKRAFDRILAASHHWNGRTIECKKAISNKKALIQYNQQIVAQKVFVTGLCQSVKDTDLLQYFNKFGSVEMAYVVKKTQKKTRIGYVSFKSLEDKLAVLKIKNHRLHGNRIFVMDYHTRSELQKPETPIALSPKPGEPQEEEDGFQVNFQSLFFAAALNENETNYRFNTQNSLLRFRRPHDGGLNETGSPETERETGCFQKTKQNLIYAKEVPAGRSRPFEMDFDTSLGLHRLCNGSTDNPPNNILKKPTACQSSLNQLLPKANERKKQKKCNKIINQSKSRRDNHQQKHPAHSDCITPGETSGDSTLNQKKGLKSFSSQMLVLSKSMKEHARTGARPDSQSVVEPKNISFVCA